MKHYSPEERAAILQKSRELLDDKPPPAPAQPAPVREQPIPAPDDPITKWAKEADEASAIRERNRAAMRREAAAAERTRTADRAAIDTLAAEVAALRRDLDAQASASNEQANGLIEFSNSVTTRMHALAALTDRLDATLTTMLTMHEREVNALRDRLAATEAAHARESAFTGRQLTEARRELDVLRAGAERKRDREHAAAAGEATVIELQNLRRDLAERGGAA
jgi:hypothetical protein